jgi:hypothetical protein
MRSGNQVDVEGLLRFVSWPLIVIHLSHLCVVVLLLWSQYVDEMDGSDDG